MKNKYLDSYIYYISIEKNLSKGTVNSYKKELDICFNFLSVEHNLDAETDTEEIAEDDELIKTYLFYLIDEKENKKITINRKITTLTLGSPIQNSYFV